LAQLSKQYHYRILTLINFRRRLLRLRPALCTILLTLLTLLRARINITLLDLSNILQHLRRLLTPRPRNRITTPIVAIMRKSPTLLSKITTDSININIHSNILSSTLSSYLNSIHNNTRSNIHSNTRSNIRNNISSNISSSNTHLRHRRILRITHTRRTAQEILP
jgi:hypothetical protein